MKVSPDGGHSARARQGKERIGAKTVTIGSKSVPHWVLSITLVIVMFCLMAFAVSLIVVYFGDEFARPSMDEYSFPPARLY
jgi:hypothetical protein